MIPRSLPRPARRRIAAGAAAFSLLAALTACAADAPSDSSEPSGSPAPRESASPLAEPEEEATALAVDTAALLRENLSTAISSGDTDALEVAFTDPVRVIIASSEADNQVSALDAVLALDYIQPGVGTWEWDLDAATIDGYRASDYYADFFPVDVIVGRSSEGPVVAFSPAGERVDVILMAIDEDLLFF
jgi:ABC-type glycerol-3-phosphate transport system substrate-binding protein